MSTFMDLVVAVNADDLRASRKHLETLLLERGGEFETKFAAHKADRCVGFEVRGNEVWFTIERHPDSWNRIQTWSVDEADAVELRSEHIATTIRDEDLASLVLPTRSERRLVAMRAAIAAVIYGCERREPDLARAWVYLTGKRCGISGAWPGSASMLADYEDQLLCFWHRGDDHRSVSKRINASAKALWAELQGKGASND